MVKFPSIKLTICTPIQPFYNNDDDCVDSKTECGECQSISDDDECTASQPEGTCTSDDEEVDVTYSAEYHYDSDIHSVASTDAGSEECSKRSRDEGGSDTEAGPAKKLRVKGTPFLMAMHEQFLEA
jgi:hypothetical protein